MNPMLDKQRRELAPYGTTQTPTLEEAREKVREAARRLAENSQRMTQPAKQSSAATRRA